MVFAPMRHNAQKSFHLNMTALRLLSAKNSFTAFEYIVATMRVCLAAPSQPRVSVFRANLVLFMCVTASSLRVAAHRWRSRALQKIPSRFHSVKNRVTSKNETPALAAGPHRTANRPTSKSNPTEHEGTSTPRQQPSTTQHSTLNLLFVALHFTTVRDAQEKPLIFITAQSSASCCPEFPMSHLMSRIRCKNDVEKSTDSLWPPPLSQTRVVQSAGERVRQACQIVDVSHTATVPCVLNNQTQ